LVRSPVVAAAGAPAAISVLTAPSLFTASRPGAGREEAAVELFDLTGKVALVTGGNGGIGLGLAKGLAAAGAAVMVAGRDAVKSDGAVSTLMAAGAPAAATTGDLTKDEDCAAIVAATVARFGRLDIVVNNAGTNIRKRPEQYSAAEWRFILETNLTSAFLVSQAAYSELKRAGGGKIVNIGSMMSIFGAAFTTPYAASKGGIVQMTKAMACAWAKDGIQVNAILPGWVDTDLTRAGRRDIPGLHDAVEKRTPAGRWGLPDDFMGIAVFLCSRASDFVTGTAIAVDGGYSVQGAV
jgi:2-deoxy-D-gluconate 3-dehydrogenase